MGLLVLGLALIVFLLSGVELHRKAHGLA